MTKRLPTIESLIASIDENINKITSVSQLKNMLGGSNAKFNERTAWSGSVTIGDKEFGYDEKSDKDFSKKAKTIYDHAIANGLIKESSKVNENINSLSDFLNEMGIHGYTEQIHAIASGDTVPDGALEDIKDYLIDSKIDPDIKEEDIVPNYSVPKLLDAYLSWNGIQGYTEDILNIYGVDYERTDLFEAKNISKISLLEGIEFDTLVPFTPEEKAAKITEIAAKHSTEEDTVIAAMEKGRKIEFEHTDNPDVADTISLHHLTEFIDYYDDETGLPDMEKNLENE